MRKFTSLIVALLTMSLLLPVLVSAQGPVPTMPYWAFRVAPQNPVSTFANVGNTQWMWSYSPAEVDGINLAKQYGWQVKHMYPVNTSGYWFYAYRHITPVFAGATMLPQYIYQYGMNSAYNQLPRVGPY